MTAGQRALAVEDLARIATISDPCLSPDGRSVAYVVSRLDVEANQRRSAIWLAEVDGGAARPLTAGLARDGAPRWSPDGRWLAFTSDRDGSVQLHGLRLDGGEPVRLSGPVGGAPLAGLREPAWSPDGRQIAFVAEGADRAGEPVPRLDADPDRRIVSVGALQHRLDGEGFRGPARRHIWLVAVDLPGRQPHQMAEGQFESADRTGVTGHRDGTSGGTGHRGGGQPRQVTDGPWDDAAPAWSPDGRAIAFVSDRAVDRDRRYDGGAVHVVDVASGAVRRLTPEVGAAAHPAWSPDGRWICYPGSADAEDPWPPETGLWLVDLDGTAPICLTEELGRSVGQRPGGYLTPSAPIWLGPAGPVAYLIGTGGATHLWTVDLPGEPASHRRRASSSSAADAGISGAPAGSARPPGVPATRPAPGDAGVADAAAGSARPVTDGQHVALEISASADRSRLALTIADPVTPPEVWCWDAAAGLRPVTRTNAAFLADVQLPRPVRQTIERGGVTFDAWLLRQPVEASGATPLLLSVHGGPHNYFGETWLFDHQLWAAQGYTVLFANPRGSGGYGSAFASAVVGDWGGEDLADLMAAVDAVAARPEHAVDAARLAIVGLSYGGYMTCRAIGQSDRFRVAVAGACVVDLISFVGTSDIGATWGVREFGGAPSERLDWYVDRSPIFAAERIATPLLLYHGEADLRCPIGQSEEMFAALKRLGRPVELLRLPGERHQALDGTPSHALDGRRAVLDFLRRHLAV